MPNLNNLDLRQLMALDLTETQALKIIKHRAQHGPLKALTDPFFERLSRSARSRLSELVNDNDLNIAATNTDSDPSIIDAPSATETDIVSLSLTVIPQPPVRLATLPRLIIRYHLGSDPSEEKSTERSLSIAETTNYTIEDVSPDHPITLIVEEDNKPPVFDHSIIANGQGGDFSIGNSKFWFSLDGDIFMRMTLDTLSLGGDEISFVDPRLERSGRYLIPTKPDQRFDSYRLTIAPINDVQAGAVVELLGQEGPGLTTAAISLDRTDEDVAIKLSAFSLTAAEFDFDGSFSINRSLDSRESNYIGWIWLLAGPQLFLGYQADSFLQVPRHQLTILLPVFDLAVALHNDVPYDVSERALLDRPGVFADDPGTSCKPFNNPGRILGERRFSTLLRITQPAVDEASTSSEPQFVDKSSRPVYFTRKDTNENNLINWEAKNNGSDFQARTVALGHVIEYAVRWRSNGYSLGDIAYSLTLAPRQTRRIVKVDFARRERASRTERTGAVEALSQTTLSDRDYSNAVASSLSEWSSGSSYSRTTGAAAGAGAVLGPFVIGGGVAHGRSNSGSSQSGGRRVAASERQQLTDAIRQFGQSVRSLESTVVTEASQEETVEGVSEVVRNVNHCHSLSVIYYEILRHLRVDTEVAGVKECIFVPMEVSEFTVDRLRLHRDILRRYARGNEQRLVYNYLEFLPRIPTETVAEASARWQDSDVPAGPRSAQTITQMSGSFFLEIGIARPEEGAIADEIEDAANKEFSQTKRYKALVKQYGFYAFYLGKSPSEVVHQLYRATEAERDRIFQRDIAPSIARTFVDQITVTSSSGDLLDFDFTLATSYQYGRRLRIDFTVDSSTLTRDDIVKLVLRAPSSADRSLPLNSFVNATGGIIDFTTTHYQRRVRADRGTRDLIMNTPNPTPEGPRTQPDPRGAALTFPLSNYEKQNLREAMEEAFDKLITHLNANRYRYHKVIWWNMDRDELYTLLDGYSFREAHGRSIASLIQHRPVGILGNSLIFQTASENPLDEQFDSWEELAASYTTGLPVANPIRVSLPTNGLYARAHMDDCNACEEHAGSRDWVLNEKDPDLADLPASLFGSRRSEPQQLSPTSLPTSIINLQNAPVAPAPTGLKSSLDAITKSDVFRDMAGLEGTQKAAIAAMQSATSLAGSFGDKALVAKIIDVQKDADAAKNLKAMTDAVDQAVKKGRMTEAAASKVIKDFAEKQSTTSEQKSGKTTADKALDIIKEVGPKGATSMVDMDADGGLSMVSFDGTVLASSPKKKSETNDPWDAIPILPSDRKEEAEMNRSIIRAALLARVGKRNTELPTEAVRIAVAEESSWMDSQGNKIRENSAIGGRSLTRYIGNYHPSETAAQIATRVQNHQVAPAGATSPLAWSAYFISYVMDQAGYRKQDGWQHSPSHSKYTMRSLCNRLNQMPTCFLWCFDFAERPLSLGDLIAYNRSTHTLNNLADLKKRLLTRQKSDSFYGSVGERHVKRWGSLFIPGGGYYSHADIVVKITQLTVGQTTRRYAETLGGNTADIAGGSNTVGRKRFELTDEGLFRVDMDATGNRNFYEVTDDLDADGFYTRKTAGNQKDWYALMHPLNNEELAIEVDSLAELLAGEIPSEFSPEEGDFPEVAEDDVNVA